MLDVPLSWLLDPVIVLAPLFDVFAEGLLLSTEAHFDLSLRILSTVACFYLMAPILKAKGEFTPDVLLSAVLVFRVCTALASAVIVFCSEVSGAIAELTSKISRVRSRRIHKLRLG